VFVLGEPHSAARRDRTLGTTKHPRQTTATKAGQNGTPDGERSGLYMDRAARIGRPVARPSPVRSTGPSSAGVDVSCCESSGVTAPLEGVVRSWGLRLRPSGLVPYVTGKASLRLGRKNPAPRLASSRRHVVSEAVVAQFDQERLSHYQQDG
jgi:hypothetical protein